MIPLFSSSVKTNSYFKFAWFLAIVLLLLHFFHLGCATVKASQLDSCTMALEQLKKVQGEVNDKLEAPLIFHAFPIMVSPLSFTKEDFSRYRVQSTDHQLCYTPYFWQRNQVKRE